MTIARKKIFVTGGSGFLGKYVIRRLIADGHQVTGLARSPMSASILKELEASVLDGDISEISSFKNSLKDLDVVIHCAAPVDFWGPWEKYQKSIVNASLELAKACIERKIKRFIYVSSEAVLQDKRNLLEIDEDHPYPQEPNSYYGKSKMLAERELLQLRGETEIIILRPTFIWGPGCPALDTISEKVKFGKFAWIDQGQANFEAVHVENVAEAIALSLTKGKNRHIYFVTDNEPSTVKSFFGAYLKAMGIRIPEKSISSHLALPLATTVEYIWDVIGFRTPPPLTRFDLAFVSMPRKYKIDRIQHDLGYRPIVTRSMGLKELASEKLKVTIATSGDAVAVRTPATANIIFKQHSKYDASKCPKVGSAEIG